MLPYAKESLAVGAALARGQNSAVDHSRSTRMWIATCCLAAGLPQLTLNEIDFRDFT